MDPRVQMVTPNWWWDTSPMPVDTLRPPSCIPLEFAYLAADIGADVAMDIVDGYATQLDPAGLAASVTRFAPTVVVVSTAPSLLYWRCPPLSIHAVSIAVRTIKENTTAPVLLIGPHATFNPEWTLQATRADACWLGAFERGLARLLRSCLHGSSPHLARPGHKGHIAVLSARQLPKANFAHFSPEISYAPHMWCITDDERALLGDLGNAGLLETSRGCPWSCTYCAKRPVRDRFERRRIEHVADELAALSARGVGYVFFIDETFNLPGAAFDELLRVVAHSGISFGFQGRADLITPRSAVALAKAGCVYAELGIDVVSDSLAALIGRRQRLSGCEQGVAAARSVIPITRFNRLNLQTLDYQEMWANKYAADWDYPADPAYPYPGAPLGEALMRRFKRNEFDWQFAQRYSWWLRIEVHLQRTQPQLPASAIAELERSFLNLKPAAAEALARACEPLIMVPDFDAANKSIYGGGAGVRIRHSRT